MPDDRVYVPSDPHGFYATLGVGPLADAQEIRDAFRKKVKLVHPDFNPADDAPLRFQALTNAYRVLRDPWMRSRYDAGGAVPRPLSAVDLDDPDPDPLECSRCGRVTAQPRYIVFHRAKSFLLRARRMEIPGIFCRECADRTVLAASTLTWLQGWWSIDGPWRTVQALARNLAGGDRPRLDNLGVLLHQARAFLSLGDSDIAWSIARQAERFAATSAEKERVARLRDEAGPPHRRLRNRWSRVTLPFFVQLLPLLALVVAIGAAVAIPVLRPSTDEVGAGITVPPAKAGEVRHVAVELLKLRQGPGADAPVLEILDRFATVQVIASDEAGEWAHVVVPSGANGYVQARFLFAGPGDEPKRKWCEANRGDAPKTGDVLLRRTGGSHRAAIVNDTGTDVVVRLKTQGGQSLIALYLAAGGETSLSGIPDGTFRLTYATGANYSRACGLFMSDMRAYALEAPQTFAPGARPGPAVRLPAPDSDSFAIEPLPDDKFVD